jgi:transcriptional regulator of NAD metabolism
MRSEDRRKQILDILQAADSPISAAVLAAKFSVSRQVIVGDIALLRASGTQISATPRGYVILPESTGFLYQVACQHTSVNMEAELNIIVDNGCTVVDVIVDHPIYGQLTGPLHLSNRYDVQQFIQHSQEADARPLSDLTEGIHLHTMICPSEAAFERICAALRELNILVEG